MGLNQNSIKHVAIIMDGNGRWAVGRGHTRVWGHIRGAHIVSDIIEKADDLNIKALTLYAFSTENWSRPPQEVRVLFRLLKKFIKKEKKRILANDIRFKIIGKIQGLPTVTQNLIQELEELSKDNKGLRLNFAFDYGSRDEIIYAVNKYIAQHPGRPIDPMSLEQNLYTADVGDVDLLIRTSGEYRISNFLLWQCAYAEFYFTKVPWPEFSAHHFEQIIHEAQKRERRFGGIDKTKSIKWIESTAKKNKSFFTSKERPSDLK